MINVRYFKYIADGESVTVLALKKDIFFKERHLKKDSSVRWNITVFVSAREAKTEDNIYLGYRGRGKMRAEL